MHKHLSTESRGEGVRREVGGGAGEDERDVKERK